jgi:hypothetical protein
MQHGKLLPLQTVGLNKKKESQNKPINQFSNHATQILSIELDFG